MSDDARALIIVVPILAGGIGLFLTVIFMLVRQWLFWRWLLGWLDRLSADIDRLVEDARRLPPSP